MWRYLVIFLIGCLPLNLFAQFDTLVINFHGSGLHPEEVIDTLSKPGAKRLVVSGDIFSPPKDCDKKCKKYYERALTLLDKKFPEVKVLYIENPTDQMSINANSIQYDTSLVLIYKIPFKKMTKLTELNLIGNDADDIVAMPAAFYSTPVKRINCFCLNYSEILKKSVMKKKPYIQVSVGDCNEIMNYLDTRF